MRTLQGRGQPGPALHLRKKQAAVKMVCTDCVCSGARCTRPPRERKCSGAQRAPCRLAMVAAQIQRRKASRFVIARPRRGRGNLGKAAALVVQGRRARENVAALSERHAGWQWLRHKSSGAKPPDLSLRGPNGAVAISQNPVESWESSGEIVTAFPRLPRRCAPRNDTSGWCRGAPAPLRG